MFKKVSYILLFVNPRYHILSINVLSRLSSRVLASDPVRPSFWTGNCHLRRAEKDHFGLHTILAILDHFGQALMFKKMGNFEILAKSLLSSVNNHATNFGIYTNPGHYENLLLKISLKIP